MPYPYTQLCLNCADMWSANEFRLRCRICHSTRIVTHPEIDNLSIALLDCDAFYAAVEIRDNPKLRGLPLIIGGGKRGVVATCSYEARRFGIHSAMPMFQALQLCPDARVLPPNIKKYQAESIKIRALIDEFTPDVEGVSIDEAFLDLSNMKAPSGKSSAQRVAELVKRVEAEIGITVSIGLSYNKFLAKLASDEDKPRGYTVIGRAEAYSFLAKQPVRKLLGVGPVLERRLLADGVTLIADLQKRSVDELAARYGKLGIRLFQFARGEDRRMVETKSPRKSLSSEITLENDMRTLEQFRSVLWKQCERVARGLKIEGLAGRSVTLKLKTSNFVVRTRSQSLNNPTQLAEVIYKTATTLLENEADGTFYRLIGVGVAELCQSSEADPPDLFTQTSSKDAQVEHAVNIIRDKFGDQAIIKGRANSIFSVQRKDR